MEGAEEEKDLGLEGLWRRETPSGSYPTPKTAEMRPGTESMNNKRMKRSVHWAADKKKKQKLVVKKIP